MCFVFTKEYLWGLHLWKEGATSRFRRRWSWSSDADPSTASSGDWKGKEPLRVEPRQVGVVPHGCPRKGRGLRAGDPLWEARRGVE